MDNNTGGIKEMESNRRIAEKNLKMIIAQEYVQEHLSKPEQYRQEEVTEKCSQ